MTETAHSITNFESMRLQTSYCYYAQDKKQAGEVCVLGKLRPNEWFCYNELLRDVNENYGYMLPAGNYRIAIAASPEAYPTFRTGLPPELSGVVVRSERLINYEFVLVYLITE
jgi:hypothetical protein